VADGEDLIDMEKIKECLEEEGLDEGLVAVMMGDLREFGDQDGKLDYQKFTEHHIER
jgi:hypothetical protein